MDMEKTIQVFKALRSFELLPSEVSRLDRGRYGSICGLTMLQHPVLVLFQLFNQHRRLVQSFGFRR